MKKGFVLTGAFLLICYLLCAQKLEIYPVPNELVYARHNDDYTVQVRQKGGEWQDLYEYKVQVDLEEGQFFNLRVIEHPKYTTGPGRGIENITFKNITYNGNADNGSIISGFDTTRKVKKHYF